MKEWYTWVFSGVGVAVASALLTFIRTKAKYFTGIRFLDRSQVDRELGTLQQRFEKVTSTVWISGNDCKYVAESASGLIDTLLRRGVRVKLLAVDPDSNAPDMLAKIDPRFETATQFRNSMIEVRRRLDNWKEQYPTQFEYRLLPILPALGFFITDASSRDGIVKIEIYTAKPWRPIDSRPHMVVSQRAKKWREYYVHQWENYWAMAVTTKS